MIITKHGIQEMILEITSDKNFGSGGHDFGRDNSRELVTALRALLNKIEERLEIPEYLVNIGVFKGSIVEDIIRGYGHPLDHLCSDCRYPKWKITPAEAEKEFGDWNKKHLDEIIKKKLRKDGFLDYSLACPKCGD